ncbi:MAG: hypothetical protein P8Y37_12930, partial [Anaerolineales bacterium]
MNIRQLMDTPISRLRELQMTIHSIHKWNRITFTQVPIVFGNAMPKSGSHLLLQILQGLAQVAPFRFVKQRPIRLMTREGRIGATDEILYDLQDWNTGVIGWGYVTADPVYQSFFNEQQNVISYFVFRDPRDQLLSSIFYAINMHQGHALHDFYSNLPLDEAIRAAITGNDQQNHLYLP